MRTMMRAAATAAVLSAILASTALVAPHVGPGVAGATPGYRVVNTSSLRAHSGPSLGAPTVRFLAAGSPIDIICQSRTDSVFGGTGIWDRLADGTWITDYYVNTPAYNAFSPGLDQCDGARHAPPASSPVAAPAATQGRAVGRTVSSNLGVAGNCTWGALEKWAETEHNFPAVTGNALSWARSARAAGWTVVPDAQARSIVVFQPGVQGANRTYGHVAWVDSVEQRGGVRYVHVTEMNGTAGLGRWDTRVVPDVAGMAYILAP